MITLIHKKIIAVAVYYACGAFIFFFFSCQQISMCNPRGVYICDGSFSEAQEIIHKLEERGLLHKLKKFENRYQIYPFLDKQV